MGGNVEWRKEGAQQYKAVTLHPADPHLQKLGSGLVLT